MCVRACVRVRAGVRKRLCGRACHQRFAVTPTAACRLSAGSWPSAGNALRSSTVAEWGVAIPRAAVCHGCTYLVTVVATTDTQFTLVRSLSGADKAFPRRVGEGTPEPRLLQRDCLLRARHTPPPTHTYTRACTRTRAHAHIFLVVLPRAVGVGGRERCGAVRCGAVRCGAVR